MRELLKELRDWMVDADVHHAGMMIERRVLISKIDASLAAPQEDAPEVARKQENYTDDFSQMISECRSHLNGVITPQTSKSEKAHFGWIALEKLRIIENIWHGIKDSDSEAADLIQPTVPMAMLEELIDQTIRCHELARMTRHNGEEIQDDEIDAIAAKYGVKIKEATE